MKANEISMEAAVVLLMFLHLKDQRIAIFSFCAKLVPVQPVLAGV